MKKLLLIFIAVMGLTLAFQNQGYAQVKKKVVVKAKTSGGSDVASPTEDKVRPKASKKRGSCYLYFDNPTGYYVNVWVGGEYQGQLPPYSTSVKVSVWTSGNWTRWEAQTIGKTLYWANDSYCNDNRGWVITL